jgi:lipopolysaccharide transport system ATP-binding protein
MKEEAMVEDSPGDRPAIFHVTHWKAGSTWIDAILQRCAPDLVVPARVDTAHVRESSLEAGRIYPRAYLTHDEFERLDLPRPWTRFIVIRDLRDTLVSAYFSARFSHSTSGFPRMLNQRARLSRLSLKEGLQGLSTGNSHVIRSAEIQRSWVAAGERLIRYEDLIENDTEILTGVLIDDCGLDVAPGKLQAAISRSRFAAMAGGRVPGTEDHTAHLRKGEVGDWRNYLHGSLKDHVKRQWGELLIATGYERDLDW